MGSTSLDDRGRIIIPKEIREKIGLRPNQRIIIEVRGGEIVLRPSLSLESFVRELRGCIHGSRIRPDRLKEIWGVKHDNH